MKALILAALLIGLVAPSAQAQSQGALEACRDINPPVVWRECIEKYEARERELKQDPKYQAEQERLRKEAQERSNDSATQRRILDEISRLRQQQEQQQRGSMNCRVLPGPITSQVICN